MRQKRTSLSKTSSAAKRMHCERARQASSTHSIGCSIAPLSFEEESIPESLKSHYCGSLFKSPCCAHCQAYRWAGERNSLCCCKGKVNLDPLPEPPSEVVLLFNASSQSGSTLLEHIRAYNNALALASLGCNEVCMQGFSPNFKIQGKLFHRIGSLLPAEKQTPKFAQLFFYDSDNELNNRLSHLNNIDSDILSQLQRVLHANNPYIQSFKAAIEIECAEDVSIILHADKKLKPTDEHCRKYNLPAQSEVAALLPGESHSNLDVVIQCRDSGLQQINTVHRSYDPLHYMCCCFRREHMADNWGWRKLTIAHPQHWISTPIDCKSERMISTSIQTTRPTPSIFYWQQCEPRWHCPGYSFIR